MNGQNYLALKNKLELHMAVHKCSVFMQDGAPCHRANRHPIPEGPKNQVSFTGLETAQI